MARTIKLPHGLSARDTLAHWYRGPGLLRLDAANPDALKLAEPMAPLEGAEDEMVLYEGIFATEDPWMLRLWSWDSEKREYGPRWTAMKLKLSPRTVIASLGTPAGVPVMWNHFTWANGALGRVKEMRAKSGELLGAFSLSSLALAAWGTSLAQIDAGMNRGLSVGLHLYDPPKMTRAKGDDGGAFDNPDSLEYKRVRMAELSLTATPMIRQAGITGRTEDST